MLTLAHDFLLLALDDARGTSLCKDGFVLRAGVGAAFLADMVFRDRLATVAAHQYQLVDGPLSEGILGEVEEALADKGPGSLEKHMRWLRGFWGNRDLEGWLKADLEAQGILRREADKFWFIAYRTRHPAADMGPEDNLIARLRDHLATVSFETPPTRDDALISLLRGCKLLDQVWTWEEQLLGEATLLERTRRAPFGKLAKDIADANRAAAAAAAAAAASA